MAFFTEANKAGLITLGRTPTNTPKCAWQSAGRSQSRSYEQLLSNQPALFKVEMSCLPNPTVRRLVFPILGEATDPLTGGSYDEDDD